MHVQGIEVIKPILEGAIREVESSDSDVDSSCISAGFLLYFIWILCTQQAAAVSDFEVK